MFTTSKQLADYQRAINKRNRKDIYKSILQLIAMGLVFSLLVSIAYLIGTNTLYLIFN